MQHGPSQPPATASTIGLRGFEENASARVLVFGLLESKFLNYYKYILFFQGNKLQLLVFLKLLGASESSTFFTKGF